MKRNMNRKTLILGVLSLFTSSVLFLLNESNEKKADEATPALKTKASGDHSAMAVRAQRALVEHVSKLSDMEENTIQESALGSVEKSLNQDVKLRQAIAQIEQGLASNDTIERLNRDEVDESERAELKETFMELNKLRAKLVTSKLDEIEEKLSQLEKEEEHA